MEFDNESVIQSQLEHALIDWMKSKGSYKQFRPPNSIQGEGFNEFAGDLVAIIQDSHLLLLELKAKHPDTHRLQRFKPDQYKANLRLWSESVPIRYAYSTQPTVSNWQSPTLGAPWLLNVIKQSPPPKLGKKDEEPQYADVDSHGSLLEHLLELMESNGSSSLAQLALACGAAVGAHEMRNGVVLLLANAKTGAFRALNGRQLEDFYNWVIEQRRGLSPEAYEEKARKMKLDSDRRSARDIDEMATQMKRGYDLYRQNVDSSPAPEGNDDDPQAPNDSSIGDPDREPKGRAPSSSSARLPN